MPDINPTIEIIDVVQLPRSNANGKRVRLSGMAFAESEASDVNVLMDISLSQLDTGKLPDQSLKTKVVQRALFCPGTLGSVGPLKGESSGRVRVDRWVTKGKVGGCDVDVHVTLTHSRLEYMAFWVELEF